MERFSVEESYDPVIVGAGPSGLATSRELTRRGVRHVVLERGAGVGHTWRHLYDSLVLHTGKHMSSLPGMHFPAETPLFPSRDAFVAYLDGYRERFRLPVETGVDVTAARHDGRGWRLHTLDGRERRARALVVATGIVANPYTPPIAGTDRFRGRIRHSVTYRGPSDVPGTRVLVVGAGNSAGEIAAELAAAGRRVALAVRSGALVVPRTVLGVPIQYLSVGLGYLPKGAQRWLGWGIGRVAATLRRQPVLPPPSPHGCPKVPLIGHHLTDAIRAGVIDVRPGIDAFTSDGVRFADGRTEPFDDVILATGYRAAVGILGDQIGVDACGFSRRRSRVVSVDRPALYFVGHNPDVRGGLWSLSRDARRVARLIARSRP